MFSLKWSLYNKTPWDYLREYSDDKKINTNETGIKKDLTPEEVKEIIKNNLIDDELRILWYTKK